MGRISDWQRSIREKAAKQDQVILQIIKKWEKEILDLIREQLQQGIKPDGSRIGIYKSKWYANMKGHDYVDLFLTGDFYYGLWLDCDAFPVVVMSDDEKTTLIFERYGDVLGLTDENKSLDSLPGLRQEIVEALQNVYEL